jgi:NADH-quinone oxidoreductase subunit C
VVSVERETPNLAAGEHIAGIEHDLEVALPEPLRALRDRLVEAFPGSEALGFRGELTLLVAAERIVDVLRFCRDDDDLRCELLADLSCVHWPGGRKVASAQETTGWPAYEVGEEEGRIDVDYVLYSVAHNHRLRLRVSVPDDERARVPSVTKLYRSALFMEREAFDFFGVIFEDHPNLTRIQMPEDWEGHPQRKDYPLGGVDVQYKGAVIPPPDQRRY